MKVKEKKGKENNSTKEQKQTKQCDSGRQNK